MVGESEILHADILIVDDKKANILVLEQMLRNAGYHSITSTMRSKDAMDLHRQHRYDLILLDLEMPGLDGFQVMEQLKTIEANGYLPVLVLTAQPEYKLRALKAGAKDFISKPFDLAEVLIRVHNMIEVRLLHLETKRLYDQVLAEKKVSERLLLNVLPQAIAERLKGRPEVMADSFSEIIADSFDAVTVLFADIVDFTKFSGGVSPEILVHILNQVFTQFDTVADRCGLEKIKTIGDAYMAVAGLPIPVADHTARAARMALEMIGVMERFNLENNYQLHIRIGISTGAAVAGVIGKRKFVYDLWGDVVNTASRMESHGLPDRIQITDSTRKNLGERFLCEERGTIDIKGKGEVNTWFLNAEKEEYAFVSAVE
ncbi:MAG: response regulator [Bacteroidetes bacterium]|nr:response regulator [Bacteroidota bacterium]